MNTFLFTGRYFPFPQPTSRPTEPSGRSFRNCSTIGHGFRTVNYLVSDITETANLISRRREVRCYLLVHFMHMLRLVLGTELWSIRHSYPSLEGNSVEIFLHFVRYAPGTEQGLYLPADRGPVTSALGGLSSEPARNKHAWMEIHLKELCSLMLPRNKENIARFEAEPVLFAIDSADHANLKRKSGELRITKETKTLWLSSLLRRHLHAPLISEPPHQIIIIYCLFNSLIPS